MGKNLSSWLGLLAPFFPPSLSDTPKFAFRFPHYSSLRPRPFSGVEKFFVRSLSRFCRPVPFFFSFPVSGRGPCPFPVWARGPWESAEGSHFWRAQYPSPQFSCTFLRFQVPLSSQQMLLCHGLNFSPSVWTGLGPVSSAEY